MIPFCLDTLLLPLVSLLFERLDKVMRRVVGYPEHNYLLNPSHALREMRGHTLIAEDFFFK